MKRVRSRLLLLVTALLIAGVTLEAGLRLAGFQPDVPRAEPDPHFGWRAIPNSTWWYKGRVAVHANSRGLRDRDFEYAKPEGTSRVFVLGDSMAEGGQVPLEQTFPKRLEQALQRTRPGVEVINGGIAGFGTAHEVLFYEHEAAKYRPDLVVLAFFMGNDIYDNSERLVPTGSPGKPPAPYFVLADEKLRLENYPCSCEREEPRGALAGLRLFLRRHTATYGRMGPLMVRFTPWAADALARGHVMGSLSRQTSWMTRDGVPLLFLNFSTDSPPDWAEGWDVTRRLIERLRDDVGRDGGRLLIAGIPAREQVHPQLWDAARSAYPKLQEAAWDLDRPDRLLGEAASAAGVPYVSLLQPMREAATKGAGLLFFDRADEAHLNAEGHAAIAASLENAVSQELSGGRE